MKTIRSCYRDSEKEQFELEILGETNEEYIVRLLPSYQKQFQERDRIHKLRKILVDGQLYKLVNHTPKYEQLTLF